MAFDIGMFVRRLLGDAGDAPAEEAAGETHEYKGYRIRSTPRRKGGVWLTAGTIRKEFPEGFREHPFIRADTHGTREAAAAMAVEKAKRIIDEQGDRMFEAE
jgi:hypothetical protein